MLLSREDCQTIHAAALEVLRQAGATALAENVVSLPRTLVEWALAQCPRVVRFADRAGSVREVSAEGGTLVFTGNALYVTRGRERDELGAADLAELSRIADRCDNVHGMVGTSVADCPARARDFVGFRIMAANTAKHLRPCIYTPEGARLVLEMAQVLNGSTSLRERPIVSTGFSILSPLHWTALALSVFRETAGRGVPVMINSEPLAGATAPVTLAGCLVIGDADVLSGLVINQLLEPGRPCIYNLGFAHVMDMSSAMALTGAPENALLQGAGADLAHFHGLPSASWMCTESTLSDEQAAFEKMITGLAHAACGVNLIWGAGNLESTLTMSREALVMDNEIAGYFLRFQRGIPVDERSLALDLIKEVGLTADYLGTAHTLAHHREVLSRPNLAFRNRRDIWLAKGGLDFAERAEQRVREILATEPVSYLSEEQAAELERLEKQGLAALG